MPHQSSDAIAPERLAEWPLPASATLGSSVRLKGIEREVRRHVPWTARKSVTAMAGSLRLQMANAELDVFDSVSAAISRTLEGIDAWPILPSEAEDILSISARERHKWLKDGRLKSLGTRTVKLRGRARAVTFHVFDPRAIEELLDGNLPELWREEDVRAAAESRRRAAGKAALARAAQRAGKPDAAVTARDAATPTPLEGWDAFEAEGLLR